MKRAAAILLTAVFLLSLLPLGALADEGTQTGSVSEDCHIMTQEWFGQRTDSQFSLPENTVAKKSGQTISRLLHSYFDSREECYTDRSAVKRKSAAGQQDAAFSDAIEALEERGSFRITDAEVTTCFDKESVVVREDGSIAVFVYEWTFFDYDDLSDTSDETDVSGYGLYHKILLAPTQSGYEIVSDEYDASDLLDLCTLNDSTKAELEELNWQPVETDGEIMDTLAPLIKPSGKDVPKKSTFYSAYDPDAVATYADQYVYHSATGKNNYENYYNKAYTNFNSLGGDCANYTSQCIYAGGMPQVVGSKYGTNGWFYKTSTNRSATWTGASQLRNWMANNRGVKKTCSDSTVYKGSPVFSNNGGHATICVGYNSSGVPVVDAHNSDMYHVKWSALGGIDSTVQLTPGKTTTPVLTIRFNANGGIVDSDTFSRDSGDYVTKNGTRDLTTWDLGYGHPSGLYNVGSFGLKRSGYSFVGWCMNKDGSSTIFDEDAFYLAETIYPNLKNGSAAITLYAIWASNGFLSGMDGVYTMTPCHAQDMRLSVAENSQTSGANIRIESAGGTKNQIFRVTRVSDRSDVYTITAVSSNLQLNVEDGKGVYNTNVNQFSAQEGNAQRWAFSSASGADNAYYIRPMADPGLCLDVAGANTAAGTNVKIYFIHDNDAQKWILTPVQLGPDLTYIPARQPTCTQPGNIAYWTNDLDGMNYADENGSIELSDEEIFLPMLGHDYVTGMTAPSCTSQGFRTHTCSRCGESYNDSYVAALGHLWDNGTVIQAPTESESGYAQYLCTRCGSSRYEFLPALEHTHRYTAYVIEPTCTEQGYTTFTCTCGDSYTDAFVPALGHYFIGGVCIRCGCAEPEVQNRADTSGLDAAIAAAEELSRGDYTRDSLAVLDLALNNAIAVRNDLWASQAEVDAAAAALEHAMRSLEKLPAGEPFRFDDVKNEKAFYFTPVYWAYEAKPQITNGLDKTHFGPNAGCTRGQVVTFLWRAAGCPEPRSTRSPFTDVGSRAFYAKAVAWAVEKGITKGMSETSFAPDATCTRGQIVTFLWRFKGSPEPGSTATGFTDVSAKAFYAKAVAWAVENKVTNGMTKTTFAPNATCTRGQIVTFLYRAMNE